MRPGVRLSFFAFHRCCVPAIPRVPRAGNCRCRQPSSPWWALCFTLGHSCACASFQRRFSSLTRLRYARFPCPCKHHCLTTQSRGRRISGRSSITPPRAAPLTFDVSQHEMIEVLFPILTLGGLALFILWESWQSRASATRPLDRRLMERGFEPGASNKESVLLMFGGVGICFGFYLFCNPPHPPFTGRWSSFAGFLYTSFGPSAIPSLISVFSIAAFIGSFSVKKQRLAKERKQRAG